MSDAIEALRKYFNQEPVPKAKFLLDTRAHINHLIDDAAKEIDELREENEDLREQIYDLKAGIRCLGIDVEDER